MGTALNVANFIIMSEHRGVQPPTSAAVTTPNTPQHNNNNNDPSPTAPKLQQQNSSSYQVGNIQLPITRVQDQGSIWLFIQRNYSRGIEVQFSTEFPQELKDANVDINVYESTINQINQKLLASEEITAYDIISGIFNYFLCNIPTLFWKSKYLKAFDEIIDLITIQNRSYFNAKGVHMNDPIMSGLRHIEIQIIPKRNN